MSERTAASGLDPSSRPPQPTARQSVRAAASKLHGEQQQAAEILHDSIPSPPELPEAEPDREPKPALFDSETDFVTATRQLIRHKKLIGSDDSDQ